MRKSSRLRWAMAAVLLATTASVFVLPSVLGVGVSSQVARESVDVVRALPSVTTDRAAQPLDSTRTATRHNKESPLQGRLVRVVDTTGNGIEGAEVAVRKGHVLLESVGCRPDGCADVSLTEAADGFMLEARAPGYTCHASAHTHAWSGEFKIVLAALDCLIEGRVEDAQHRPVAASVDVFFWDADQRVTAAEIEASLRGQGPVSRIEAAEDGTFRFEAVEGREYRVAAGGKGYLTPLFERFRAPAESAVLEAHFLHGSLVHAVTPSGDLPMATSLGSTGFRLPPDAKRVSYGRPKAAVAGLLRIEELEQGHWRWFTKWVGYTSPYEVDEPTDIHFRVPGYTVPNSSIQMPVIDDMKSIPVWNVTAYPESGGFGDFSLQLEGSGDVRTGEWLAPHRILMESPVLPNGAAQFPVVSIGGHEVIRGLPAGVYDVRLRLCGGRETYPENAESAHRVVVEPGTTVNWAVDTSRLCRVALRTSPTSSLGSPTLWVQYSRGDPERFVFKSRPYIATGLVPGWCTVSVEARGPSGEKVRVNLGKVRLLAGKTTTLNLDWEQ